MPIINIHPAFCIICGKFGEIVSMAADEKSLVKPSHFACHDCHMEPENFAKQGNWVKRCRCEMCTHFRLEYKKKQKVAS